MQAHGSHNPSIIRTPTGYRLQQKKWCSILYYLSEITDWELQKEGASEFNSTYAQFRKEHPEVSLEVSITSTVLSARCSGV